MPILEQAGGWMRLDKYKGPEIPASEWEDLTYTTYSSDPTTYFAPITSATGEIELKGFWEYGKADLDGVWTPNAEKCPSIVKWVESIGARFGRVQLLRMSANTMRECRWGLHLDNNNQGNPENQGWVVRVWLELTDDPSSALVVRPTEFDRKGEVKIALPKYQQAVVDSEFLWHGGHHTSDHVRYAVIASVESGPALERWIEIAARRLTSRTAVSRGGGGRGLAAAGVPASCPRPEPSRRRSESWSSASVFWPGWANSVGLFKLSCGRSAFGRRRLLGRRMRAGERGTARTGRSAAGSRRSSRPMPPA